MASKELKERPSPTKDVKFTLVIRVYGEGYKTQESHGFILDDLPMGVSDPVVVMPVNIRILTLKQLRPILMYDTRHHMKKRSVVWQEVLYIMGRLPNIYDRPKSEKNLFQFGFCRKDNLQSIQLIHPTYENRSIAELIGSTDFFSHDLIIVPLTQISQEVQHAPAPELPEIPDPDRMMNDIESESGVGACETIDIKYNIDNNSNNSNNNDDNDELGDRTQELGMGEITLSRDTISLEGGAPRPKKKVKKKKVIQDGKLIEKIID